MQTSTNRLSKQDASTLKGMVDAQHDSVVRIDRIDKPIEWQSSRTDGGEFEVVVEASDNIRLITQFSGQFLFTLSRNNR